MTLASTIPGSKSSSKTTTWQGDMENKNYEEVYTWATFIGDNQSDNLDWDDIYGREAMDYRRAERDGWGNQLVWDGK
jgi:hypothetical protein